jgi:hypothetical protein
MTSLPMPEPALLTRARTQHDPDSTEFCKCYDRLMELTNRKFARPLTPAEFDEIASLRKLVRQALAGWLEKR